MKEIINFTIHRKHKAFTLAEVLITLAIIGVVAALTVPTIIRNYQERETITALKKFYAEINQAFTRAQVENGTPENWDWGTSYSSESAAKIIDILAPYLKITKKCNNSSECFAPSGYKTLNKDIEWDVLTYSRYAAAQLTNGLSFWVFTDGNKCASNFGGTKALSSVCGRIGVDLNGYKKPNQLGRDTFYFWITKYGMLPQGTKDDTLRGNLSTYCRTSSTSVDNGFSCAAWILTKGNMDYLKQDVNW